MEMLCTKETIKKGLRKEKVKIGPVVAASLHKGEKKRMAIQKTARGWVAVVPTGERHKSGRKRYLTALEKTKKTAKKKEVELYDQVRGLTEKIDTLLPQKKECAELFETVATRWIETAKTEPSPFNGKLLALSTWERYHHIITKHLIPPFGNRAIDQVLPDEITTISKSFREKVRRHGYAISFHSLRHSHASILIMVFKMDAKTVCHRLGHASEDITLRVYSAFFSQRDSECADIMGKIFSRNSGKRHEKDTTEADRLDPQV